MTTTYVPPSPTTVAGYVCSLCSVWVPSGIVHVCSNAAARTEAPELALLRRIADRLDQIGRDIGELRLRL